MKKMLRSRLKLLSPPASTTGSTSTTTSSGGGGSDTDESPASSTRFDIIRDHDFKLPSPVSPVSDQSHKSLAVLSGHVGAVSSIALCGEFILSASQGDDIIVWQQPDLRKIAKFGQGSGSVKALLSVGNRVFTAHQDRRIRVWRVSRSSENVFKLVDTLPTTRDYLCRFIRQSNYVQTRRHHKKLWIEHADSISCLAFCNGCLYSGSWDRTVKVWRVSDLKCLESIRAHDDAINGLVSRDGKVYSASADGKIKVWGRVDKKHCSRGVLVGRDGVSLNAVAVSEDGSMVYGAGSDGYVISWSRDHSENWDKIFEWKAHDMAVLALCMTGELLCTGSADKSIGIWRRGNDNGGLFRVGIVTGHQGPIKCLQASPVSIGGGFMLYSGGLDRSLRTWWVPNYSGRENWNDTEKI